jgi:hypothetical protein
MADAKQLVTLVFILVPARGLYVQQWYARGIILRCTVVLVEGGYKRAGEEVGPPGPEVLIEANANIVVKAESVQMSVVRRPPVSRGLPLLL